MSYFLYDSFARLIIHHGKSSLHHSFYIYIHAHTHIHEKEKPIGLFEFFIKALAYFKKKCNFDNHNTYTL